MGIANNRSEELAIQKLTEKELLPAIKEKLEEKIFKGQRLITTHQKNLIVSSISGKKIESDFIVLDQNNAATGAVHVKLNFDYPEDLKLLGKLILSLKGISKTWVAIERSMSSSRFEEGVPKEVGIIRFTIDNKNNVSNIELGQEATKLKAPYLRKTHKIILEELQRRKRPRRKPMKIFKYTGEVIKKARIEEGWNQSDFARRVNMKQPDISAIEKGRKNITLETLARLCKILDIKNILVNK